jgi:hypothetical protein
MAKAPTTRALSDKHADRIAELFEAPATRGSGNQHHSQTDNRMPRDYAHQLPFCFEGKATQHRSLSLKLDDWEKLVVQAHDLRPALAHRFYLPDNRLLPLLDLITVRAEDFSEVLALANARLADL